jgi:two-component system OmpR family sensor kinase
VPQSRVIAIKAGLPTTRLVVMMAHSLRETEGTISTVTAITIGGALAVLVLAAVLSLLVVGGALRPLAAITAGVERLARGDYGYRLELRAGTDEVGRLARAFNNMAAAIATAFATQRRFVADASHELRTPLTALRGYTDVLLMGVGDDPAEAERILRAMQDDLGRMSRLVNDLLILARLDGGAPLQLGPVALADLLAAAEGEATAISRDARTITCDLPADDLVVWGDRDRLRQVLSNLLGNACAYTPPGTTITLRAAWRDRGAILEVEDNGPGIAPADLVRLGERFYRGDTARSRQTGGAGLGIAIARSIVEAHGGSLTIRSVLGEGTCVTVRLPLATSLPAGRLAAPATSLARA